MHYRLDPRAVVGAAVVAVTALVTAAFYANHWGAERNADTVSYLNAHPLVDDVRLPVYPLFLDLLGENLAAAAVAQGVLFVAAVAMLYVVALLVTSSVAIAAVAALVVGTNLYLLSFAKPLIVEGVALFFVTALALSVVLFLREPRPRWLWTVAGVLLLAIMTRPEWLYAPIPLFVLLVLLTRRNLARHAAFAVTAIYLAIGGYVAANAALNNYPGLTEISRINAFSKVLQYRLEDNAPARYAALTADIKAWFDDGGRADPYEFEKSYPEIRANDHALAGEYARATIPRSLPEFMTETAELAVQPQHTYAFLPSPGGNFELVRHDKPFFEGLGRLRGVSHSAVESLVIFPAVAAVLVLLWNARRGWRAGALLVLALLALYDFVIVIAGAYGDYMRINTSNTQLRLMLVTTATLLAARAVVASARRALPTRVEIDLEGRS